MMDKFDAIIRALSQIKLSSSSKAEFEFFKMYFRGHYAEDFSQAKNSTSDFVRIGKEFHRWVSENAKQLGLQKSRDYIDFIERIKYFADVYIKINALIQARDTKEYLYLIVNSDYGFTMQPAVILSAVSYKDSDEVVNEKIKVVSRYLTKVLTWRVWNHWMISQSALEAKSYELCNGVQKDMRLAMHYYADAADKGVPEAAFVLGEYLRNAGDRANALKAYQQAVDGGYAPAQARINQMKNGQK